MNYNITRDEFCEICKSEGLEVVCEEDALGPHSTHATAYLCSPLLSREKDSFADWDYTPDDPYGGPWVGYYDALRKEKNGTYHVSTADLSDCPAVIHNAEELREVCHNAKEALRRLESDPTYRPECIEGFLVHKTVAPPHPAMVNGAVPSIVQNLIKVIGILRNTSRVYESRFLFPIPSQEVVEQVAQVLTSTGYHATAALVGSVADPHIELCVTL